MQDVKIHQKTWFIILWLILFFPIGIYLMWKYTNWDIRLKWAIVILLGLICVILAIFNNKKVIMPNLLNMKFEEGQQCLDDKGFYNIVILDEDGKQISKSSLSDSAIIVDQNPKFDTEVKKSSKVELTVIDLKAEKEAEEKKNSASEKNQLKKLKNKDLTVAVQKAKELNYKFIFVNSTDYDMTDMIPETDYEGWIVDTVKDINTKKKKVTFVLTTTEIQQMDNTRKELESKISETSAYEYLEKYGERIYQYGFKAHYIMGNHSAYVKDSNTWKVKVDCTITNAFNAKREASCEADVQYVDGKVVVSNFIDY